LLSGVADAGFCDGVARKFKSRGFVGFFAKIFEKISSKRARIASYSGVSF
jgi:hypothetical protein